MDNCEKKPPPSWKLLAICDVDINNFCLIIKEMAFCREVRESVEVSVSWNSYLHKQNYFYL